VRLREKVLQAYRHCAILEAVRPVTSGNDVTLRPAGAAREPMGQLSGEPDFEVTVTKNLARTPEVA